MEVYWFKSESVLADSIVGQCVRPRVRQRQGIARASLFHHSPTLTKAELVAASLVIIVLWVDAHALPVSMAARAPAFSTAFLHLADLR